MKNVQDRLVATSALMAAIGLALALPVQAAADKQADPGNVPQIVKDNMARMVALKLQKCYGISAVAKNDCSEGAHSCAGQATQARDPGSYVLLPIGDCEKIQGGKVTAG